MVIYIIKSGLCLLVLFSFYKLFLENEQFHGIKRFYLLTSLIISFVLPLITITYGVEVVEPIAGKTNQYLNKSSISEVNSTNWQNYLNYTLLSIYLLGVAFFAFRFCKNLRSLLTEAKRNEQLKNLNYIFVLLSKTLSPYSFLNYIFLNKSDFKNDRISKAVIEHEKAHVDQKHSLDLLFIEFFQIFFWFNPIFIWLKRSIKLNHEYLADKKVLSKNFNALEYSNILFNYSSGYHHNSLSSPINHSLIKKRIIMTTKNFSLRRLLLRSFILIPILGACIYLFNEQIVAKTVYLNSQNTSSAYTEIQTQDPKTISIKVENQKIWLNKKEVSLKQFSEAVDELTASWSEDDLKDLRILMNTKNSEPAFMDKLDKEFSKTRLSKVTGNSILPPPPPLPPAAGQVPPPPPAPPHPVHDKTLKEDMHKAEIDIESMRADREAIRSKQAEIRSLERKYRNDKKLPQFEREKVMREMERKQDEIERKHIEMERELIKIERKLQNMPAPPPPPQAPDPIESINKLEKEGGSFYHNGKTISANEARKIIRDQEYSRIEIRQGSSGKDNLEIMD